MQSNNHSDSKPTPPAPAGAEELAAVDVAALKSAMAMANGTTVHPVKHVGGYWVAQTISLCDDVQLLREEVAQTKSVYFQRHLSDGETIDALRAENATLRNAQKACEDCMTPTYAALREEVEKLKADVSREVTLCDQMTMQRVPIDDDGVREFVLMALSRHTLLNRGELQYCADQILTAFAPTWEKLTAAEARCRELEVDKARLDWLIERGPPGASEDGMGLTDEVWEVAIAHAGPDMKTDNQAVRAAIDAARQRKD